MMKKWFDIRWVRLVIGCGIGVISIGIIISKTVQPPNEVEQERNTDQLAREANLHRAAIQASIREWELRAAGMDLKEAAGLFGEAMAIGDPVVRRRAVALIGARWLTSDCRAFLNFLDEMEVVSTDEIHDWQMILPGLRDAVLHLEKSFLDSALVAEMVAKLMAAQADQDPHGAASWIEASLAGDLRDQARAVVVGALALSSPDQAKLIFTSMRQAARRIEGAIAIGIALAEKTPEEAFSWANSLELPIERQLAVDAVLREAATVNLGMASRAWVEYSERLRIEMAERSERYRQEYTTLMALNPNSDDERTTPEAFDEERQDETERLLASSGAVIAREIAAQDPQAALSWVEQLPTGELRTQLWAAVLGKWAEDDPAGAWKKAATVDRLPISATGAIFEAWGHKDARNAAANAEEIRDLNLKNAAVAGVAAGWLANPDAVEDHVAEWAVSLPPGKGRDEALVVVVDSMVESSPQNAWNLALMIKGDNLQKDALASAFSSMLDGDVDAAKDTLVKSELSEPARKRLVRMLKGATDSGL